MFLTFSGFTDKYNARSAYLLTNVKHTDRYSYEFQRKMECSRRDVVWLHLRTNDLDRTSMGQESTWDHDANRTWITSL